MRNKDTSELIPTRSSLLSRLNDWNDAKSWREFFDIYWKLIYNAAVKAGLSDAEAQDVVQDTVLSVAKKMHDFRYDPAQGSFKGWLLQLTRWRILNQLKKRLPQNSVGCDNNEDPSENSPLDHIPDPASVDMEEFWEREWRQNLIGAAIDRIKEKVSARQYEIFFLHVIKKIPAASVASTLRTNVAGVYLAKHRVSAIVKKEVRRLERQRF